MSDETKIPPPITVTARRDVKGARRRVLASQAPNRSAGLGWSPTGAVDVYFGTDDGMTHVWLPPEIVSRIRERTQGPLSSAPDTADVPQLVEDLLGVIAALMPGVRYIAVQDYAALNDVPIRARQFLAKARGQS
jgi:hypothetical protein